MFNTLESNWDQSAHRGRATLASFTIQAFTLSLLVAISILWVERPPQVHWLQITAPTAFTQPAEEQIVHANHNPSASNPRSNPFIAQWTVPREIQNLNDAGPGQTIADAPTIDVGLVTGPRIGIVHSIGDNIAPVIPSRPIPVKPLVVSNWAAGNLIYRVQPTYPSIARQARIQGTVELRAIISKAGTIENLIVVSGHPTLVRAALDAVKQWRYRPYLLNNDPIEVETEITVNFLLSGG